MKICFIGKYPPIEGGVSAANYWFARALGERGHEVYLVTNAPEVEEAYRMRLTDDDAAWYQPTFPASGGFVKVFAPERLNLGRMAHIPQSNPFVSKLAATATEVIRRTDCQAILAYYYEPYGVAAHLAASWTGRPLALKHAGSDLDRLMKSPALATAYKEVLRSAAAVLTRWPQVDRFLGIGVDFAKIFPDPGFFPPRQVFHPEAEPLAIGGPPLSGQGHFDPAKPAIGIYGKVGVTKGSFDLVSALGRLQDEGFDFNFLALTQGAALADFQQAIVQHGIGDRTWILPFVPHWKVPRFIRACTAVCCLERDFPVKIHGPGLPREVLLCGTCLVLSGEITRKQAFAERLVDEESFLRVEDPKDHEELAAKLRFILRDPQQARAVGREGCRLAAELPDFEDSVTALEQLLLRIQGRESSCRSFYEIALTAPAQEQDGDPAAVVLERSMPWARVVFGERLRSLVRDFCARTNGAAPRHPFRRAMAFCDDLREHVEPAALPFSPAVLEDVLRFQKARLFCGFDDPADPRPAFDETDVLAGGLLAVDRVGELRPLKGNHCRVESFQHDVTPFFSDSLSRPGAEAQPDLREKLLSKVAAGEMLVLFHRLPNLARCELKLNAAARELLDLCDGRRSTAEILAVFAARQPSAPEPEPTRLERDLLATLSYFYRQGVIVFLRAEPPQRSPHNAFEGFTSHHP